MNLFLGLDIGTTRTKLLLWDATRQSVVDVASTGTPVSMSPRGDTRDPDAVLEVALDLARTLASRNADLSRVRGISAASVGEETVFIDHRGRSIGPIATWYAPHSDAATGTDSPSNTLASWYAIRDRTAQSLSGATGFTDLGSYVLMRLAGRTLPITDITHASRTGMLSDDSPEWNRSRLKNCGAANLTAPEIVSSGELIGELTAEIARDTGLPVGTPVRAGSHDHIVAAHAAGVRSDGQVFISSGTSETQLVLTAAPWKDVAALERPGLEFGGSVDRNLRYLHVSQPAGARVAEICGADTAGRSIEEIYEALDGCVDGSGAREDSDATVVRLREELEEQARIAAQTTTELTRLGNTVPRSIIVAGVPTTQPSWRAIRRRFSERELVFADLDEASAVGAAMLAAGPPSPAPIRRGTGREHAHHRTYEQHTGVS